MCMQCLTESSIIIEDIVPGYLLARGVKDHEEWPAGHYAVIRCNDPIFVFPDLPKPPTEDEGINDFDQTVRAVEEFGFTLDQGYHFTTACIAAGYAPETDGRVMYWFLEYVYNRIHSKSDD